MPIIPLVFIFPLNTLPIIILIEVKKIPGMAKKRKSQTVRRLIANQRNSKQITIAIPLYINNPLNIFCVSLKTMAAVNFSLFNCC